MTNEEKVLAVWPDAREVQLRRGKWLIAHGNDPERPGYSILGPEFASTEAAWQNAAESLPAQPEQELCPYCRETKDKCLSNEYCYSTHWEVAPVEAKEKERCAICELEIEQRQWGSTIAWIHTHNNRKWCEADGKAEPKPSPSGIVKNKSTPECREFWNHVESIAQQVKPQPDSSSISTERVEKSLAEQINSLWTGKEKLPCGCPANSEYIYYNSETGHAHCVKCGDAYTHDSQSEPISTEQTFEEWKQATHPHADRVTGIFMREAWNAAKGKR